MLYTGVINNSYATIKLLIYTHARASMMKAANGLSKRSALARAPAVKKCPGPRIELGISIPVTEVIPFHYPRYLFVSFCMSLLFPLAHILL